MKPISPVFLLVFFIFIAVAKISAKVIEGELIIQLEEDVNGENFVQQFKQQYHVPSLQLVKHFSKKYRLYLLSFDPKLEDQDALMIALNKQNEIQFVSINSQATLRDKEPNDPDLSEQVNLDLINASEVWDSSIGGNTLLGDTIVVANFEPSAHIDIEENYWFNWEEIPNDGFDNDDNGFVDDFRGVNITDRNDVHPISYHGTSVGGIIAAKGNNNLGVTGVNWNVKLMRVSNDRSRDEIIEGLTYVYNMRKKYNETGGNAGAFVVAVNTSFGFPEKIEANSMNSIWCELYEDLGSVGVLSVASTSNIFNANIDLIGDMPTSCPSDFLISVTDTNMQDQLEAAIGKIHIDLSAPGTGTYTTETTDVYGTFGGTSAAAPHVAGGIALLYSLPCEKLAEAAINEPKATALLMKEFILNGTKQLDDLQDKTLSGGRLDLKGSMDLITRYCGGSVEGPLAITQLSPNPASPGSVINVTFQTPDNEKYRVRIFNALGQLLWSEQIQIPLFEPFEYPITTANLSRGVYFLSIENTNDIQVEKFMVY